MNSKKRPIGVDLFAGAGGMTLGFEQAGFDVLAAVELDPIHCATHEFNFPFWSILCRDITNITGAEIRESSGIGNRDIDVVFGGSPCQGFSLIGKRGLDDPRNALVFHFHRLVIELNPKFFVFENVPGLTLGKHKVFLLEIIDYFRANGYQVEENYKVLNSANYGVPQNRSRLFLLGCRKDLYLPKYPEPITAINKRTGKNNVNFYSCLPPVPTVWDAIGDLPKVEIYSDLLKRDWVIAKYSKPSDYAFKLRGIHSVDKDYSYGRKFDWRILTSSLRTNHSLEAINRFKETERGKIEKISHFYKLNPEGICNTLRAGTASNLGAFTSPRPIHPFIPRCITVREAARLHSYPDWFRFHVTKWHGFRQVGNSVPPFLAKAIASEIICVLGVSPVKPKRKKHLGNEELLGLNMFHAAQRYGVSPHAIEPRKRLKREI
ncbi:DNA cytosine methyltransferase [Argonema antarcticum]|uniref:DNA cytosine methyltransferase n=1 Tax=Argonema antarcticum TaxID=2942763 RepID=UPI002011C491|nr:DNA cytosine methyltransferase [Argonema antarcticum]MCL1472546.1 DNA cytosine methyltransferase [Argonema antarcticum A004/B2]